MRLGVAVSPARQAGIPADARLSAAKFVTISEEEMTLTAASRTAMLDELADVVTHFSLHTADPGATGTSEVSGGSYARVSAVWGAATDFQVSASPAVFTIPAGTPRYVGFWSASSGGTFYGSAALASPSAQFAGSFTVPVIRVYLDAGDVSIATGVSSDELRLLLHDGGLLQAPLHVDPKTRAFSDLSGYDSEQGGWPLRLPATATSKALAVTAGSNKSACWFGARADGTEVLWLDCAAAVANVSCTVPSFASPTTWTVEWSGTVKDGSHIWQSDAAGTPRGYTVSGDIGFWDGAAGDVSASTVETLLGIDPEREDFEARWVAVGTSLDVDVRVPGGTWVSAISGATITAVSLPGAIRAGRSSVGNSQGQHSHLRVRSGGVGSSIVAEFTPSLFPAGNRTNGSTAVDGHGVTWTLTKPSTASTDEPKVVLPGARRFVLPGVASNHISTPDTAALSITGDIDIRCAVALDNWAAAQSLLGKWVATGNQRSWQISVTASGSLQLWHSADGSTSQFSGAYAVPGQTNGEVSVLRVTVDVDNGAGGRDIKFYTSDDGGLTWGDPFGEQTVAGATSIFDSTAPLEIGSISNGTGQLAAGSFLWAEVYDGIDGTLVERIDPADASPDTSTFVSATSGATVTVNRSTLAGYKVLLAEADETVVQFNGVNDFLRVVGDLSVMDFDPADGLTLVADVRMHNTTLNSGQVLTATSATQDGALIQRSASTERLVGRLDDGAAVVGVGDNTDITYGVRTVFVAAFGDSDHEAYIDGVSVETVATAVAAEPAATLPTFGRREDGGIPLAFDLYAFGVVEGRKTDSDVTTISTELGL